MPAFSGHFLFFNNSVIINKMQVLILSKKNMCLVLAIFLMAVFDFSSPNGVSADSESDVRGEYNKTQDKLDAEQKNLNQYTSNLQVTQGQINSTANLINKTEAEISRKESELKNLQDKMELNRNMLMSYVQAMYYEDQETYWKIALNNKNVETYLTSFDYFMSSSDKLAEILKVIEVDKEKLEGVKKELADKKAEHEELLAEKQSEKKEIVADINETKLTISQLQAKLNKLKSALSNFLGKSFDLDDVVKAVEAAEKKTGVRKQFLFAVLDKETDLGRFTGGCTYDKSKMGSANLKIFKEVCDELGYNYKKVKVSCPLSYGIGGAMGVAQFMPTTWAGYKTKIANLTGSKPADPWDLQDGVMGMALKLKAAGADKKSGEFQAAAMYYCGGNWKRTVCKNYANMVISWSKGYDDYFR